MRAFAAGQVIASRNAAYAENDRVMGMLGWQEYAVTDGKAIRRKVVETDLPLSLSLGILGLNGVTAYFALTEVGEPRPGDTVVVSTAAGAVGSAVGQIGTASVPSWEPWPAGPRVERHLLNKSARMQGFLVWDYEHRYNEAVTRLAAWIRSGQLRYREEILDGLEASPDAIAGLYRGENLGKRVIKLRHG